MVLSSVKTKRRRKKARTHVDEPQLVHHTRSRMLGTQVGKQADDARVTAGGGKGKRCRGGVVDDEAG